MADKDVEVSPDPPVYKPDPAKSELQNLIAWKVAWLDKFILARKRKIDSKQRQIDKGDLDQKFEDQFKLDIEELKKLNTRTEDEKSALTSELAFNAESPGASQNAELLESNVKKAIEAFDELKKDAKQDKVDKLKEAQNQLKKDLKKVRKDNPKLFKK